MTTRLKGLIAVLALTASLGIAAGCSEVDPSAAETPDSAETVVNSAVQTDADGNTIVSEPQAGGDEDEDAGQGGSEQAEAGLIVFQGSCSSCHLGDGQDGGGIGPALAGAGLDAEAVRAQTVDGGGGMPGGLVSGQALDDVVAYVESLQ